MGGIYPGQSAARVSCDHLPPIFALHGGSAMQGKSGSLMWSVAVHWVCWPWGFQGGAGQGQPPPVFFPGPPSLSYKASERAAICAGLGDSQVKPSCESKLAAANIGPGAH